MTINYNVQLTVTLMTQRTMQPHCLISINHIFSLISSYPALGFSGSRNPYSYASISVSIFLPKLVGYSGVVGVGCAKGVDKLVWYHLRLIYVLATYFADNY